MTGPQGTGGVTAPQPQSGTASSAISQVQNALRALQQALPNLPMGSDLHTAVLKSVSDISKKIGSGEGSPALQTQSLLNQLRQAQQQQPMAQIAKVLGQGGGQAPPVMPQPAAEAA